MLAIRPDAFRGAEQLVCNWLDGQGFAVGDLTYHRCLEPDVVKVLQRRCSSSALVVRTRADRIAVHRTLPCEFLVEVKSPAPRHYANALIEMLPLAMHVRAARDYSVRCLYTYVDISHRVQPGFWCHEPPPVQVVVIPDRWDGLAVEWFEAIAHAAFPEARISYSGKTRGSGDPFALIAERDLRKLADWRALVQQTVESHEKMATEHSRDGQEYHELPRRTGTPEGKGQE